MATVTLYPAADAYVDLDNPTTNYGSADYLIVEGTVRRAWVRFDLSSIAAGQVITSATLSVYPFYAGIREMNVQRCSNISWSESTITWNNAPNGDMIDNEIFRLDGYGPSGGYQGFDVTGQITDALSSGGVCWRIKQGPDNVYLGFAWLSEKDYAEDCGTKLVITYADAGTTSGFVDVPPSADGYISGTLVYEDEPYSRGFTVYGSGTALNVYNSSSAGREVDRVFTYFNTATSNLESLGMPAGATVTSREYRIFCLSNYATNTGADAPLMYSATGGLGSTITLDDWDFPGCTDLGDKKLDLYGTGWKIYTLPAHNSSGYTNVGFKTGLGVTDPSLATFSSTENSDENTPVIRIYYSYTAPTTKPRRALLGVGS